jgi:hypothetical protein
MMNVTSRLSRPLLFWFGPEFIGEAPIKEPGSPGLSDTNLIDRSFDKSERQGLRRAEKAFGHHREAYHDAHINSLRTERHARRVCAVCHCGEC